ncbi:MAG: hypothetical protein R3349_09280 [Geminicoccaceae bacterium]|nr:hypothetical protein [Geminicoccaceae bacterium]
MSKSDGPLVPVGPERLLMPLDAVVRLRANEARLLQRLLGRVGRPVRRIDLLLHQPRTILTFRVAEALAEVRDGDAVALPVVVTAHRAGFRVQRPHRVVCRAADGPLHLVFFQGREAIIRRRFVQGHELIVGGVLSRFGERWQMVHPTLVARPGRLAGGQERQTVYPSIKELSLPRLRRLIELALDGLPALPEWHRPETLRAKALPGLKGALVNALLLPALEHLGLALGQVRPHREPGFG